MLAAGFPLATTHIRTFSLRRQSSNTSLMQKSTQCRSSKGLNLPRTQHPENGRWDFYALSFAKGLALLKDVVDFRLDWPQAKRSRHPVDLPSSRHSMKCCPKTLSPLQHHNHTGRSPRFSLAEPPPPIWTCSERTAQDNSSAGLISSNALHPYRRCNTQNLSQGAPTPDMEST